MNDASLQIMASLAKDGISGDLIKAAKFSLAWSVLSGEIQKTAAMDKESGMGKLLFPLLMAGMIGYPVLQSQLQRSQMEAYNRGRVGTINEMAPMMAAMYGPYGGLGMPTSMRNLTGLQGQGMA